MKNPLLFMPGKSIIKSSGVLSLQYIDTILAVDFLADCYSLMVMVLAVLKGWKCNIDGLSPQATIELAHGHGRYITSLLWYFYIFPVVFLAKNVMGCVKFRAWLLPYA